MGVEFRGLGALDFPVGYTRFFYGFTGRDVQVQQTRCQNGGASIDCKIYGFRVGGGVV